MYTQYTERTARRMPGDSCSRITSTTSQRSDRGVMEEHHVAATATVFMRDVRVSTNVSRTTARGRRHEAHRAALRRLIERTTAPTAVRRDPGACPASPPTIPSRDASGKTIGVLYAGVKKSEFYASFERLRLSILLVALLFGAPWPPACTSSSGRSSPGRWSGSAGSCRRSSARAKWISPAGSRSTGGRDRSPGGRVRRLSGARGDHRQGEEHRGPGDTTMDEVASGFADRLECDAGAGLDRGGDGGDPRADGPTPSSRTPSRRPGPGDGPDLGEHGDASGEASQQLSEAMAEISRSSKKIGTSSSP